MSSFRIERSSCMRSRRSALRLEMREPLRTRPSIRLSGRRGRIRRRERCDLKALVRARCAARRPVACKLRPRPRQRHVGGLRGRQRAGVARQRRWTRPRGGSAQSSGDGLCRSADAPAWTSRERQRRRTGLAAARSRRAAEPVAVWRRGHRRGERAACAGSAARCGRRSRPGRGIGGSGCGGGRGAGVSLVGERRGCAVGGSSPPACRPCPCRAWRASRGRRRTGLGALLGRRRDTPRSALTAPGCS